MGAYYNYLIISAIGLNRSEVIQELARACLNCGCNLLNSKMNIFGQHLSIVLFLSGNWGAIAKMEAVLPSLEQKLGLAIQTSRTQDTHLTGKFMAYTIQVVAIDRPGILNNLTDFFQKSSIQIEEISAHTYLTNTGTRMASLHLKINVAETVHLATLREKFMSYCDDQNLDGFIEPLRSL